MVQVKLVGRKNNTYLIEWVEDGRTYRSFVPVDSIHHDPEGESYHEAPHIGSPYGIAWSMFIEENFSAEDFEAELHRRGIWTMDDLSKNPSIATSSLQKVLGNIVTNMRLRVLGIGEE